MLIMAQVNLIRKMYFEEGANISEISRKTGHDRKTVRMYLEQEDFNQEIPSIQRRNPEYPSLDPFKSKINEWLENDKKAKRKQRHTAKRVFDRLCEEFPDSFNVSYRTVASYVSCEKARIYGKNPGAFLPLRHIAGEVQADFGDVDFYEGTKLYSGKSLDLSFPYSNKGYAQLFEGENQQCLFEGLITIFEYIGGVPTRIWFDNASTMVTKILKGGNRNLTDAFLRFKEHYRFEAAFCNAASGHEKGSVENKVGYIRRNMFVPVPRFSNLDTYNKELLTRCDENALRDHYRKEGTIENLYAEDLKALLDLPRVALDARKYIMIRTNAYGKFLLNKGFHEYSVGPKYANKQVLVRLSSRQVSILDDSHREIVTHKRLYGETKQSSMNWLPYLNQLSRSPGALKYTGIYDMFPGTLKAYLDPMSKSQRGEVLKMIAKLTQQDNFDTAVKTVETALMHEAYDTDSLLALHTKLHHEGIELPPIELNHHIPRLSPVASNLESYNYGLMMKGGDREC